MQKIILVIGFLSLLFSTTIASGNKDDNQIIRRCGTVMPSLQWQQDYQLKVQQFVQQHNTAQNRENATYNLPVIVHVVYWNAVENITQTQINSQIDILNADYAGTGLNVNTCPSAFQSLISNTNISFCKAAKTPGGATLAEPGIDRVNAQTAGFTNPGTNGWLSTYIDNVIKPATTWDATKYLNIWVLPLEDGTLGYATFPGGPSNEDGVVIGYLFYGNTGTVSTPYDKGRTTTHEIGHWLGLFHISGDEECGDDSCNDTPPQRGNAGDGQGLNYDCPTFPHQPNSCTGTGANGELFMNFMDYTDDACMYLFTPDQRTRMQTAMSTISLRVSLASSTACNTTPQAPVANFSASRTALCPGNTTTFSDLSQNNPTSWSWSFSGGTPSSSTSQNPTVTYNSIGTYTVTLTATNGLGSDGETKTAYITVANPTGSALPFSEGFQTTTFPPTGWSLVSGSGFNWERVTTAGGFGTSSASVYFHNFDDDANDLKDDIVTPSINLNGATNPRLKFDVAYTRYSNNSKDTLEVLITDICSGTVTSIYKKGGANLSTTGSNITTDFVPSAAQWRRDSVFIPGAYLNKYVKVIFRNNGAFGNNIYVDNVNLYGISTSVPTATAGFTVSDTTVCIGGSLTFTNTSTATSGSPDSVRWTIPGGTPSTSNSTTTVSPTFNSVGTYVISLVAYKSGNASIAFTKSIRVKAKPTVAVTSPAICSGKTAQPVASGAASYTWTGGLTAVSNPTTPLLTTTTTYTVTGSISGCSNTAVSTVTVTALPNVTVTSPSICTGSAVTLQASGAGSYTWTGGLTAVSNPVTPVLTTTTTYTVTGTTGSCSKTAVATVTVSATLNVTVNSISICSGSAASLQASGATSYTWTGGLAAVSNPTTPVLTTTTTYTVTGSSGSCSKTAVAIVTVKPTPNTPTLTQSHDTLYSNVIIAGASYEWYKSGILQTTTSSPYYKFTSNGAYTLKIINNACPSAISANFNAVLTGIKSNKLNIELSILPNPNNGSFEISISSAVNKAYQLKLYNLSGQILLEEEMNIRNGRNSKYIHLTGIEKGVYFLSINGEEGSTTQNIIVQ